MAGDESVLETHHALREPGCCSSVWGLAPCEATSESQGRLIWQRSHNDIMLLVEKWTPLEAAISRELGQSPKDRHGMIFFSFVVSRVLCRLMKQCTHIYGVKWKWNCVGGTEAAGGKEAVWGEQTVSYTYLYTDLKFNFKRAVESCHHVGWPDFEMDRLVVHISGLMQVYTAFLIFLSFPPVACTARSGGWSTWRETQTSVRKRRVSKPFHVVPICSRHGVGKSVGLILTVWVEKGLCQHKTLESSRDWEA